MKKLNVVLFALFASIAITSCSNDDEKSTTTGLLVGKWQIVAEGSSLSTLEAAENGDCELPIYEFSEGGAYTETTYEYDETEEDCVGTTETGTWSKTGNTLTIKDTEDTTKISILALSEESLTVKVTEEGETKVYMLLNLDAEIEVEVEM